MAFVVTLVGFRPPPRQDGVKWTEARIEESPAATGPWTVIDTQAIADYADATDPPTLSFTTDDAALEAGWYRIVFLDTPGNGQAPTAPVAGSGAGVLLPPSPETVRSRSALLQARFPADPVDAEVESSLRELVADTTQLVEALTCRTLDTTLPDGLERIAIRAVVLKAESMVTLAGARESTLKRAGLREQHAGPWGESYFGPEEASKAKVLDPDPPTHEALWALATEACREAWLALWGGKNPPAGVLMTFDYTRQRRGY